MKKLILTSILLISSSLSHSYEFVSGSEIKILFTSGVTTVGIDNPHNNNTCNYHGSQFHFDATTDAGKNMLSLIMAAYISGKKINIWYSASTAPGTDHTNGCTRDTMALIGQVGFN